MLRIKISLLNNKNPACFIDWFKKKKLNHGHPNVAPWCIYPELKIFGIHPKYAVNSRNSSIYFFN